MNKQYITSVKDDLAEINAQVRTELFQAKLREDQAKFELQMNYLRSIPEVPAMIEKRLAELNQAKSWLILQIGWTRKTYYERINFIWFRPSEVKRIEAIFKAEEERQKTA